MSRESDHLAGARISMALTRSEHLQGEDETDTLLLRKMASEAEKYLASFSWCKAIHDSYFGGGFGGILAVFLFQIESSRTEVSSWIWIICGDIPSAYLPVSNAKEAADAYLTYVQGLERWITFARRGTQGSPEDGVPPLALPCTPEAAAQLERKLNALFLTVAPLFRDRKRGPNDILPLISFRRHHG